MTTTACILAQRTYKPGDPPPDGYLAWHEWAEVQHKAGLRQKQCGRCGLWNYPQELSGASVAYEAQDNRGNEAMVARPVCNKCFTEKERVRPTKLALTNNHMFMG